MSATNRDEVEHEAFLRYWGKPSPHDASLRAVAYAAWLARSAMSRPAARPEVVCLCGSTRFIDAFTEQYGRLTDEGKIVLSVGRVVPQSEQALGSARKVALDELHLRKIDLCDRVLVLNVGGYVGQSTRREIAYAREHGKPIDLLYPDAGLYGPAPAAPATEAKCQTLIEAKVREALQIASDEHCYAMWVGHSHIDAIVARVLSTIEPQAGTSVGRVGADIATPTGSTPVKAPLPTPRAGASEGEGHGTDTARDAGFAGLHEKHQPSSLPAPSLGAEAVIKSLDYLRATYDPLGINLDFMRVAAAIRALRPTPPPAASDPVRSMLDDLREAERFAASAAKVCDEAKAFAREKSVENESLRAALAAALAAARAERATQGKGE